jgi:hypothetical protein
MPIATKWVSGNGRGEGTYEYIGTTNNIKFVTVNRNTFKTDSSFKTNGTPDYFVLLSL